MKIRYIAAAIAVWALPAFATLDNFVNFAKSSLASGGISSSTTSITLVTGGASRFPAAPFNATIWNASNYSDPSDDPAHEIVRVTVVTGDVFTVTRAQEGTAALAHNGFGKVYYIAASITAKTLSDINAGLGGGGTAITALTGDVTATGPGSVAGTLATVNSNTGSFGSSTAIPNFTVNGKGLVTAAGTNAVVAPAGTLSGNTLAGGVTASSLTSFGASPTLTTPTIASFINATHSHSNAAGGGQIDATTALSNGTNGSGQVCLVNTPTLITPNIGAATAGGTLTMGSSNGILFNGSVVKAGGANILNIANGTNAQSLRVYNTDDGAGNAEYGMFDWAANGNSLTIGAVKTGSATQRSLIFNSGSSYAFQVAGSQKWTIDSTTIQPAATNTSDLGLTNRAFRTAYVATSLQGSATKTLPETTATGFVTIAIPNSGGCAGYVDYTVFAADATNTQLVSGQLFFSAAATSGGTVTAAAVSDQHTLNPVTSGTLTNTMTSTTGANLLTLLANATSSLTQTTLEVRYRVMLQGGVCTVTGL
jgi:hypothetical protein